MASVRTFRLQRACFAPAIIDLEIVRPITKLRTYSRHTASRHTRARSLFSLSLSLSPLDSLFPCFLRIIVRYWEVTVITLRKIAIMGIATGLQTFEVQLQTMFMMTVLFIAIMLHIQYEPYEYDSHDDLELWSLVAGMITLFIGM